MREDVRQGGPVFQHQLFERVQSRLRGFELTGISLGVVAEGLHFAHHILNKDAGLLQTITASLERHPTLGDGFELSFGAGEPVDHRRLGIAQSIEQRRREIGETGRVPENLTPASELVVLSLGGTDRVDLLQLEGDRVETVTPGLLLGLQPLELFGRLPPSFVELGGSLAHIVVRSVVVNQTSLHLRVREPVLFVLSVDREQMRSDALQGTGRDNDIVDPRAAAAPLGHLAADDQTLIGWDTEVVEDGPDRRVGLDDKQTLDLQPIVTGADEIRLRALASQEFQRFHQQRFSGPRFARQHGKSTAELELDGGDNAEAANGQSFEHCRSS